MSIILEVELTDPDEAVGIAKKYNGDLFRRYWAPCAPTAGDGEICLFQFPSAKEADDFVMQCFGLDIDWELAEEIPGFYSYKEIAA